MKDGLSPRREQDMEEDAGISERPEVRARRGVLRVQVPPPTKKGGYEQLFVRKTVPVVSDARNR